MTDYRELPPPPPLAEHVACLWVQHIGDDTSPHRVVPDACADIVAVAGRPLHVVGPATEPVLISFRPGTLIVGARFRPGVAAKALGLPVSELRDQSVALAHLWGGSESERLAETLHDAGLAPDRVKILARHLTARLERAQPIDPMVRQAVRWLALHPSGHVDELASALGVSSRQLLRRFGAEVGYGPKMLQRVLRFQRLLCLSQSPAGGPLVELAAEAGYVNQAHMTREVAELGGVRPTALRESRFAGESMSEFFKTLVGQHA